MRYNLKLTIKAIIKAEQILLKPFTDIDYSNHDDLLKLLYCAVIVNNQSVFTFEEFCLITENEKQLSSMLKELEKTNLVLSQFVNPAKDNIEGESGESRYIKDLAGLLIMEGLDASYAMNDMEISDIPIFIKAYENKKREEMEARRLWTFLAVAPHIDTKKIKSPVDLYPFPWEEEERRQEAKMAILKDKEMLEKFFNEGVNMFPKK